MDLVLAILLVFYIITMVLNFIVDLKQERLIQEILKINRKLILERGKIVDILINTKLTESNSLEIVKKIEKILKGED